MWKTDSRIRREVCERLCSLQHYIISVIQICKEFVFFPWLHKIFRSLKCIEIMSWCSVGTTYSTLHLNSLRYTNREFQSNYAHTQNVFWHRHVSLRVVISLLQIRLVHEVNCHKFKIKNVFPVFHKTNGNNQYDMFKI